MAKRGRSFPSKPELGLETFAENINSTIHAFSERLDAKLDILLTRTLALENAACLHSGLLRDLSLNFELRSPRPMSPKTPVGIGSPNLSPLAGATTPRSIRNSPCEDCCATENGEGVGLPLTDFRSSWCEGGLKFSLVAHPVEPSPVTPRVSFAIKDKCSEERQMNNVVDDACNFLKDKTVDDEMHKQSTYRSFNSSLTEATKSNWRSFSNFSDPWYSENPCSSMQLGREVWLTLNDPAYSQLSAIYHYLMPLLHVIGVLPAMLQIIVVRERFVEHERFIEHDSTSQQIIIWVEFCFEFAFMLDLILRILSTPRRGKFICDVYNIIDIMALACLPVRLNFRCKAPHLGASLSVEELILFSFVPILRLLGCLRHFELLLLLLEAFREASKALPVLLFVWGLVTLIYSSLVYVVEDRSNIASIPHAAWLVIVTWSTVGYGDIVPKSAGGTLAVAITIFSGVLYMAIPIGLISQVFGDMWKDRARILFIKRLKKSLQLRNIQPQDVPKLFAVFDLDRSGEIDVSEWEEMMQSLQCHNQHVGRDCGFRYFTRFDDVHITPKRFVHVLWPDVYHEVFGLKACSAKHVSLRHHFHGQSKSSLFA